MAAADVGDDWYGEDPTVNRLLDRAAEITGKEAALFVPTGTMANQIALHVFVRSGHLAACESAAHVGETEVSSSAVLSGIGFRRLDAASRRRQLTADFVAKGLEPDPLGVEVVDLLCLENTHQVGGGSVMPLEELRAIGKVTRDAGAPLYLDGARIFNAAVAAGCDASDFSAEADALMFCLSKGLGAPVGSILCGGHEVIREARRVRILFGGAWRQAGVLAAAGLIALEVGPKRLHEDHERARRLAEGVADAFPEVLDPGSVETNMVFVDGEKAGLPLLPTIERLAELGVRSVPVAGNIRMVTHVDIGDEDVDRAIGAWHALAKEVA